MAYVPVPKDLSKVKTKVAFNLTKRQLIFFGIALLIGLPVFFIIKNKVGTNIATYAMIFIMIPCFLFAMYEKHGQPLETVLMQIIHLRYLSHPTRPYQTENFYSLITKQAQIYKEVDHIVYKSQNTKANTKRRKTTTDVTAKKQK